VDPCRQQRGGPGMAPRRNRRVCVDAAVLERGPERTLHAASGHRVGGGRHANPASPRRREAPYRLAMPDPLPPKQG
jgi:hypothetical protein